MTDKVLISDDVFGSNNIHVIGHKFPVIHPEDKFHLISHINIVGHLNHDGPEILPELS
jgi:hypothetical protein